MLTFIGLWNFADDYGVVKANHTWLKNQIYPYKDKLRIDTFSTWLDRLSELEAIILFTYRSESFYCIRTFRKHQKVDKPSKARNCPEDYLIGVMNQKDYALNENHEFVKSWRARGGLVEGSPQEGEKEGDIGRGEGEVPLPLDEGLTWDINADLLSNKILFEKICCAAGKSAEVGLFALSKYHLWLQGKEQYPKARKALYASFQLWLRNEKGIPSSEMPKKIGPTAREIEEAENRKKLGM